MKKFIVVTILAMLCLSVSQVASQELLPEYSMEFSYGDMSLGECVEILSYKVSYSKDTLWYFMCEEVVNPEKINGLRILAHNLEYGNKVFKCYDKEGNYKYLQYPFYKTAASLYDTTIKRKIHQDSKGDWYHTYHYISTDSIPNYFTEYDENVGSFVLTHKKNN